MHAAAEGQCWDYLGIKLAATQQSFELPLPRVILHKDCEVGIIFPSALAQHVKEEITSRQLILILQRHDGMSGMAERDEHRHLKSDGSKMKSSEGLLTAKCAKSSTHWFLVVELTRVVQF